MLFPPDPSRIRFPRTFVGSLNPLYKGSFMLVRDVVILSAARTAIGRYGGSFKDLHPTELGAVAARAAIERAGIRASDVDEVLIGHGRQAGSGPNPGRQVELNEAFAVQVLAVLNDMPIPADRLNVNGGAIALEPPIGCTGARIVVTLLHELERRGAKRSLATLCVSGGMGMALAIERIG